jgi:hypothetical protein
MKNQLLLFESDQAQTPLVAVLQQLPSEQRKVAAHLLAELMARGLVGSRGERGDIGTKEGANE